MARPEVIFRVYSDYSGFHIDGDYVKTNLIYNEYRNYSNMIRVVNNQHLLKDYPSMYSDQTALQLFFRSDLSLVNTDFTISFFIKGYTNKNLYDDYFGTKDWGRNPIFAPLSAYNRSDSGKGIFIAMPYTSDWCNGVSNLPGSTSKNSNKLLAIPHIKEGNNLFTLCSTVIDYPHTNGTTTWMYPDNHIESIHPFPDQNSHHVALCRKGNILYMLMDGYLQNQCTMDASVELLNTKAVDLFATNNGYGYNAANNYFNDFLFLKGVALWTSDYKVPTDFVYKEGMMLSSKQHGALWGFTNLRSDSNGLTEQEKVNLYKQTKNMNPSIPEAKEIKDSFKVNTFVES